jgi:hypothetical protein
MNVANEATILWLVTASMTVRDADGMCLYRYVLEFEKCLDKTEPVPWEVIRGRMRAQLGRPLEDVFSFVDPVPLASASVAQVHAAGGGLTCTCCNRASNTEKVLVNRACGPQKAQRKLGV